jgi:putative DNA primase/helicase
MLMCSEWLKNKPFDEAFVKQLTGNDPVSGRSLYAEQEEFVPVGKLWLMVNNMPKVRFDDSALWRRVVPIPFMRRFVGRKADPRLEKKLEAERSGILNWALTGAELYAKEGRLELCDSCLDFRKDLRGAEDTVGAWIESECKRDSAGAIQARNAYDAYAIFIKGEKREPVSRTEFKATLDRKGFRHRRRNSFNEYQGLRLRHPLP